MSKPFAQSCIHSRNARVGHRSLWIFVLLLGMVAGCSAPAAPAATPIPTAPTAPAATAQPVPFTSADIVRARALAWLSEQELPSGGFADSQGQISPNNTSSVWQILAALPASEVASFHAQAALTAMQPAFEPWLAARDSGPLARAVLGVTATGGDPHQAAGLDLLAELWANYDAQTGFFHPESFFRHLLSVQALIASGETVPEAALAAMGHAQIADGSWSWRISTDSATVGDVDTTAQALITLAAAGVDADDSRVQAALGFLAQTQSPEGGWAMDAASPPNADSTGLVLTALGELGLAEQPESAIRAAQAQSWLASLQQADGSFHYSADLPGTVFLATLDALPAFQWQFKP